MTKILLSTLIVFTSIMNFAQSQGPNSPGIAVGVPNSSCLSCPGSDFNNIPNVYMQDNAVASVALMQNGNCFQSTCYYSRYIYASNFGFTIPGTATITGIVTEIYRQSGNVGSATDSTIRLGKTNLGAVSMNKAGPNPWPLTAAYYSYGSAIDMWATTWTPTEINSSTFGLWFRVFNMSTNPTTPTVDHIRITVYYSTSTGIFSQTYSPSALNAYQNNNELEIAFISNEQIGKGAIKIFNLMGDLQMKKELTNIPAGMNSEKFALNDLAPGIYFVRLESGTSVQTRKIFIHD